MKYILRYIDGNVRFEGYHYHGLLAARQGAMFVTITTIRRRINRKSVFD